MQKKIPLYVVVVLMVALTSGVIFMVSELRQKAVAEQIMISSPNKEAEKLEYGSMPALADKNFFETVKNKMISEESTFIEANLSDMALRYYENGSVKMEMPIRTKGREGSWWETPAGLYRVESKIDNHFSGFAKVYLPWSLPFQGNFFIHGWPYYQDGSPVSSQYSGGCIRLSTENAEKLYGVAKVGMPVLVFEKDFEPDNYLYKPGISGIDSGAYLAADIKSNFVFGERNSKEIKPIGSVAKLLSALVAVEYINIEHQIKVKESALVPTAKPRLTAGRSYSVYDLLHPMLLESSNEAAEAIAAYMSRANFVNLMNQKARAIGMTSAVFVDPSGVSDANIGTAEDLFALSKYLYNNRSFILKMSAGDLSSKTYGSTSFGNLGNTNLFGDNQEFVGGIGGSSEDGRAALSVFESDMNGSVRPYAVIILGSEKKNQEAERLYSWVRDNY